MNQAAARSAPPPSQSQDPSSPLSRALQQPFTLGLFLPIHKGAWTPSAAERTTTWKFDYNMKLAQTAEALGFDLVFGFAQWLSKGGLGGRINFRDQSIDPFMTTAALATATKRILLISTVHVLYGLHPTFLAKLGATLDHITGGRWGVNIVTGYRREERYMFGLSDIDHDLRYEMIDEYAETLSHLWTVNENLTKTGRFWNMTDAHVTPRPAHIRPIMVNAGNSAPSIAYAARYSDLLFITSPAGADIDDALEALPPLTGAIQKSAAENGRVVRPIINPLIICRDTEREAWEIYNAIAEQSDPEVVAQLLGRGDSQSWVKHSAKQRAVGGNVQLVGTPEQITERMLQLKAAGCGGVQISFFDFAPDLDYFGAYVLPLLHQAGLRKQPA
jgi:FMNH2-dependent dimethyl sulfone monooxygenase